MPPAKSTWKGLEARVCKKFKGTRVPLSGSNSQHGTSADCMNCEILPDSYIEIKHRQNFTHHTLFRDAAAKAKKEGKLPLLVTHVGGEHGELVTLRLDDLIKLLQAQEPNGNVSELVDSSVPLL